MAGNAMELPLMEVTCEGNSLTPRQFTFDKELSCAINQVDEKRRHEEL
jgi:hypothetical protein